MSKARPRANYSLSENGRARLSHMFAQVERAYGGRIGEQFNITPTIEQVLIEKLVQLGSPFLNSGHVSIIPVIAQKGQKVWVSASGATTSRTNTKGTGLERVAKNFLMTEDGDDYDCIPVENDILVEYTDLDAWAAKGDIGALYNDIVAQEKASGIIMAGFHGTSAADTTDISAHPNLEDVNVGWLQHIRVFSNPGFTNYVNAAGETIGAGGTFPTLDSLVTEAKYNIPLWLRKDLVVYVSDNLVGQAEGRYYQQNIHMAEEKIALLAANRQVLQTFGGLEAIVPPFFPDNTVLVCPRGGLQYYMQRGSLRRTIRETPEVNGVSDWNSHNGDYRLADRRMCFLIEGMTPVVPGP